MKRGQDSARARVTRLKASAATVTWLTASALTWLNAATAAGSQVKTPTTAWLKASMRSKLDELVTATSVPPLVLVADQLGLMNLRLIELVALLVEGQRVCGYVPDVL